MAETEAASKKSWLEPTWFKAGVLSLLTWAGMTAAYNHFVVAPVKEENAALTDKNVELRTLLEDERHFNEALSKENEELRALFKKASDFNEALSTKNEELHALLKQAGDFVEKCTKENDELSAFRDEALSARPILHSVIKSLEIIAEPLKGEDKKVFQTIINLLKNHIQKFEPRPKKPENPDPVAHTPLRGCMDKMIAKFGSPYRQNA